MNLPVYVCLFVVAFTIFMWRQRRLAHAQSDKSEVGLIPGEAVVGHWAANATPDPPSGAARSGAAGAFLLDAVDVGAPHAILNQRTWLGTPLRLRVTDTGRFVILRLIGWPLDELRLDQGGAEYHVTSSRGFEVHDVHPVAAQVVVRDTSPVPPAKPTRRAPIVWRSIEICVPGSPPLSAVVDQRCLDELAAHVRLVPGVR